jgi:hypothetical protein
MVGVLEDMVSGREALPKQGLSGRISGWSLWAGRTLIKRFKDSRPSSHNRPEFQRHRYPEISLKDMQARISRFKQVLKISEDLKVTPIFDKFFLISV